MLRLLLACLITSVCFAPACFISRQTVNRPVRPTTIAELVPGQTTAKEVVAALGAPAEVVQLGNRSAYRYDFLTTKRAGFTIIIVSFLNEDTRSDRAWLFFDAEDVLSHAGATFQGQDAEYAMPWQRLDGH